MKILVAVALLMAASLTYYFYVRNWTRRIAENRAKQTLEQIEKLIHTRLGKAEVLVNSMHLYAEHVLDEPDEMFNIAQNIVESSHSIMGADVAFVENYYREKGRWYEPWVGYEPGCKTLSRRQIGSDAHDYTKMDWFINGLASENGCWSDPYHEQDITQTSMMTYARAIHDKTGRRVGVISADIALDTLASVIKKVRLYPHSYCVLTSEKGDTIVAAQHKATGKCHIYSNKIDGKNMILTMIIPDKDMYSRLRKSSLVFVGMALLGMLAMLIIARSSLKNARELNEVRIKEQQIEDELAIARNIQKSLLPDKPLTEFNKTLDISGMQLPAKYVGGDLYDYYVRDNKLYFCIGDVSGKGMPAALLMAIAHSLFRTLSAHSDRPERIMQALNASISENNPDIMFITMFLGVLDLGTGILTYSNAGHNPPVLIQSGQANFIEPADNLLLGVEVNANYSSRTLNLNDGDTLFLYTDGLTEAENAQKELLGEQKALDAANQFGNKSTVEQINDMLTAVKLFAGEAEQSDDLTMLAIRYLHNGNRLVMENNVSELNKLEPFLNNYFEQEDLDISLLPQISLALEEALANVIMYAYPEGQTGTVELSVETKDRMMHTTIKDSGIPFNPLQQKEANLDVSLEERQIGGLGIHLIKEIMSKVEYEYVDGSNVLKMTYDL